MKDVVFSGHQPNFLPYMGFFYKIAKSDIFVLDDDVQFSNDGWHNYNFIKVGREKHRITVPVTFAFGDRINEVKICYASKWDKKLIRTIELNYSHAPFYREGMEIVTKHIGKHYQFLSDLNIALIQEIADRFGLKTRFVIASIDVPTDLKNNERNVYQCRKLGADVYYSGTGGKAYNDEKMYHDNGIRIVYSDYKPVVYKQQKWNFIENLSVLDYIFNCGFNLPEGF